MDRVRDIQWDLERVALFNRAQLKVKICSWECSFLIWHTLKRKEEKKRVHLADLGNWGLSFLHCVSFSNK